MVGFELAARPAVSLFKLNSKQIVDLGEFAIFDYRLAAVIRELKRDNGIRGNRLFNFQTSA